MCAPHSVWDDSASKSELQSRLRRPARAVFMCGCPDEKQRSHLTWHVIVARIVWLVLRETKPDTLPVVLNNDLHVSRLSHRSVHTLRSVVVSSLSPRRYVSSVLSFLTWYSVVSLRPVILRRQPVLSF